MSQMNLIGRTLGRFEILSELGRGGMAVVYKARQADLDRIVAIKLLPPDLTHDASYIARFRQEARSAARLEHPHIMPIYEVGEAEGLHYIAMKFIAGRTLKELVQEDGALSVQRAAQILAQVGDALDHAHRHGVIHRDIKPSNIMITDEGWVYLTDFGLARGSEAASGLTMAGTVMGTPEYMSPEQAQGLPSVGPPTDIYALGVVLYELLTGTFPFQAETPMGMLAARLLQAPTPPRDVRGDLPTAVEDVVMRSLARKPEARFASAAAMVAALRAAAGIGGGDSGQRPATPAAGMPALGATILAAPTPPYVQAQQPTPPPRPQVAAPPLPRPAPPTPAPGLGALPTMPAPPYVQAQQPARRGPSRGLLIGVGAAAALLVLALIGGGLAMIRRPGPAIAPTATSDAAAGPIAEGDAALAAGELSTAIASYRQAADASAGSTAALGGLALTHNLRGDWPAAEASATDLVNAALKDDRAAALGLTLLADAIASQGGVAEAAAEIRQALALDGELALAHAINSNILASQALAARDSAGMDAALAEVDTAVDSLSDETPLIQALTHNAIAYTFAQEYFLDSNKEYYDQSADSYAQAMKLAPKLAVFPANLGYLLSADEQYSQARGRFADALKLDPGYVAAQAGIGWSYFNAGEADKAAAAFDAAIELDGQDYAAYYGKGRLAYDDKDYAAAIDLLGQAATRNPRSADVQTWLGEAYLFTGFGNADDGAQKQAYASAEAAYRSAITIDGQSAFAISGLGWILQYQERYDESVAEFQKALKLDDRKDETHVGLGWSLFWLGKYDQAEGHFRDGIARDDDNNYASAHYGLGRALEEQGQPDAARAAYQEALQIDPENSDAQTALDRVSQ